jgi:uncharacterized protein YegP (UPF0339 family)
MAQPRFQLVPGARLVGGAGTGIGWRLLGANNRELGRSASAYPDAEAALDGVGHVREIAVLAQAHIVHDSSNGMWAWQVHDSDGAVAATSGRGFRHERECRYNLEQFRSTAPSAPTSDTVVPVDFPWQRTVGVPLPSDVAT